MKAAPTAADRFVFSKLARFLRLAQRVDDRQTSHLDRLASRRLPPILALEVETGRAATSERDIEALDVAHGSRKSNLGRRADCR